MKKDKGRRTKRKKEGRGKRQDGKMEEGRRKKEEGSGSRNCQVAPRRHQGGTEEAQGIYIDSNAPHIKDRNLNM